MASGTWSDIDVVIGVENPVILFSDYALSAQVTNLPILTFRFADEEPNQCSSSPVSPVPASASPTPSRSPPLPSASPSLGASHSVTPSVSPSPVVNDEYESFDTPLVTTDVDEGEDSSSSWSGSDLLQKTDSSDYVTLSGVPMNNSWITYVVFGLGIVIVVGGVSAYLLMKKARAESVPDLPTRARSGSADERPLNRFSQMEEEYNQD